MKILVSMRTVENTTYAETRDALSHDWSVWFSRHGITPILVPNALGDIDAYFTLGARGLLLSGGENLAPDGAPSPRDRTETLLLEGSLARGMPVFGTCRGLQMINRHFGGRVAQELPEKHVGEHAVTLTDGSTIRVNSFHNQGVLTEGLASGLVPFAKTEAGVIEAFVHPRFPLTAVQWHPERPNPAADLDRQLARQWLDKCK